MSGFKYSFAGLLLAGLMLLSCSRKVESSFDAIDFVDRIVADSLPRLQELAASAGKTSGSIALVGEPLACSEVARCFMEADGFDNIDASRNPDGLPDFSGETIVAIMDFAHESYDSILANEGGDLLLKEIAVRSAIAALDTATRCKSLVLCSPLLHEHALADIEDFFEKIGCTVPVISSADSAYSYTDSCFLNLRARNAFTHDIAFPALKSYMTTLGASGDLSFRLVSCSGLVVAEPVDSLSLESAGTSLAVDVQTDSTNVSDQH